MNRYETITELGDNFVKLVGKGLIPIHLMDYKVYYENYLMFRNNQGLKVHEAVQLVSANYDISKRKMYYVISVMESF